MSEYLINEQNWWSGRVFFFDVLLFLLGPPCISSCCTIVDSPGLCVCDSKSIGVGCNVGLARVVIVGWRVLVTSDLLEWVDDVVVPCVLSVGLRLAAGGISFLRKQ